MAFPQTILPIKVEAKFNGWTDITSEVYNRGEISISRGRPDEASTSQPSSCRMQLNNRDGNFSPRNPSGSYYGFIGRNTPMRVSVSEGEKYLLMTGNGANYISCPDSPATSVTGDIEVQADMAFKSFQDGAVTTIVNIAGKASSGTGQRSWILSVEDGYFKWQWSADGSTYLTVSSTVRPCPKGDRFAVKLTHDVNNGASGNTVRFYLSDTIDGSWTQVGEPIVTAGTTSIFNSTSSTVFGSAFATNSNYGTGRFYAGKVLNGIGGTVVAFPDLRNKTVGASSFSDGTNTWTVGGTGAEITNRSMRFIGEVSSWPVKWDQSVTDIWTEVEASGILRRLAQGASPLESAIKRGVVSLGDSVKAYWPMEDGSTSQFIASGLSNGKPMYYSGVPSLSSFSDFDCSSPIPTMSNASFTGLVRKYSNPEHLVSFLMAIPAAGETNNSVICRFKTVGSVAYWELIYTTGGGLTLTGYNENGTTAVTTGPVAFGVNGKLTDVSLLIEDLGTDIKASIVTLTIGDALALTFGATLAGADISQITEVSISPNKLLSDTAIGHVRVINSVEERRSLFKQLNAWTGEEAGRRIQRLCEEEEVPYAFVGDTFDTTPMGAQLPSTFIELVRQCEASDGGIIFEPRDYLALGYRTRNSMYSQDSKLNLNYANNDLSSIEPVDDDQFVINDVTVTRVSGSSSRQVDETSSLSVQAPPAGVGKYDTEYSLSLEEDTYLDQHASWRLHLGTVDEQRYPGMSIQLQRDNFTDAPSLYSDATILDVGDRFVVEDVPTFISVKDISQIAVGYTETLSQFNRTLSFNTIPADAYNVAYYDTTSRYSGEGTVTNAFSITTTQTTIDIACPVGVEWTTVDGSYDIIVNGEVMTVTSVTPLVVSIGTQTMTVVRSVNGIIKTHGPGEKIKLATPSYWALTV